MLIHWLWHWPKKMLNKMWLYIKKLVRANSQESSKRFLGLYCVLILVSYLVFRFGNDENCETILIELLTFVTALMGVASWQSIQKKKPE